MSERKGCFEKEPGGSCQSIHLLKKAPRGAGRCIPVREVRFPAHHGPRGARAQEAVVRPGSVPCEAAILDRVTPQTVKTLRSLKIIWPPPVPYLSILDNL